MLPREVTGQLSEDVGGWTSKVRREGCGLSVIASVKDPCILSHYSQVQYAQQLPKHFIIAASLAINQLCLLLLLFLSAISERKEKPFSNCHIFLILSHIGFTSYLSVV